MNKAIKKIKDKIKVINKTHYKKFKKNEDFFKFMKLNKEKIKNVKVFINNEIINVEYEII